jgi:hypothetical protein
MMVFDDAGIDIGLTAGAGCGYHWYKSGAQIYDTNNGRNRVVSPVWIVGATIRMV